MILFENPGEIDIRAAITLGVSVKTSDSAIGFFGTGFPNAVAVILRNSGSVTVFSGCERYEFSVAKQEIRGKAFNVVLLNGRELQFTTEYGKTWAPWQAFRELYANVMDEGGTARHVSIGEDIVGEPGRTRIYVDGADMDSLLSNKGEIFLQTRPLASTAKLEVHSGMTNHVYYRTVRAHTGNVHCLYTYNITTQLDLTEDRTIKHEYAMRSVIAAALVQIDDESIIEKVLFAPPGTFENGLNFDVYATPSEAFMNVVGRHRFNAHLSRTARELWEKHTTEKVIWKEVHLDRYEQEILADAMKLLKRVGCDIHREDFMVVSGLGANVFGVVRNGRIYIAHRTFDVGARFLASTLYEEWLHKTQHLADESRELQNHLLDQLFGMVDRLCRVEDKTRMIAAE